MKKIIVVALVLCLCAVTAFGAIGEYTVTATLNPDVVVKIDGKEQRFFNAQGQEVHPISYAGTTYVPIRAIGEIMGKNVDWNADTYTATIGGTRTTPATQGYPDNSTKKHEIALRMEPHYTIVIDGTARTFYDVNGKVCDPSNYQGSIYLPIRAIGEIMGKTVGWDGKTQTVTLDTPSGSEVTDYDTLSGGNSNAGNLVPNAQTGQNITLEQAKNIALNHAGKTAAEANFTKAKLDYENGKQVYEIEFVVKNSTGYTEYDYEIEAATGTILSYDYDAESYSPVTNHNNATNGSGITEDAAKDLALQRVPGATTKNIKKFKTEYDDGKKEYEGKIVYNNMEYEFTIDAATGNFTEWDVESVYH